MKDIAGNISFNNASGIYNFPFVNRDNERVIINSYISSNSQSSILWLYGEAGCGKTTLVNEILISHPNVDYVYIKNVYQCSNYIEQLIKELEKRTNTSFSSFIKRYKNYYRNATIGVLNAIFLNEENNSKLIELLYDGTVYFFGNDKSKDNPETLIDKYLDSISKNTGKKLVLIFDEMQTLGEEDDNFKFIIQLIQRNYNKENIKFLIISDIDDTFAGGVMKEKLKMNLITHDLLLEPLNDITYFYDILNESFLINDSDKDYIDYIFECSNGNIENLKKIIRNLFYLETVKIDYNTKKAYFAWKNQRFHNIEIIEKKNIDLNPGEKIVLGCLVLIGIPVFGEMLCQLSNYIKKHFFKLIPDSSFQANCIICNLCEKGILVYIDDNEPISFINNLVEKNIRFSLANLNKELWSSVFLNYLKENKNNIQIDNMSYELAYCLHAYRSRSIDWIKLNFALGFKLYQKKHFSNSYYIFKRLLNDTEELSHTKLLVITNCCYDVGHYKEAMSIAKKISIELLSAMQKYNYYYIFGKICNMISEKELSINSLRKARMLVSKFSEEDVAVISILHFILHETGEANNQKEAKKLYHEYVNYYLSTEIRGLSVAKLFRTCVDYYQGESVSMLLNNAIAIAEKEFDEFEKLCCINNLGFEYVRLGNLLLAKENFLIAKNGLMKVKPHESSYALNNYSVCLLIDENSNWHDALSNLRSAEKINESPYASMVIRVNMALCYLKLISLNSNYINDAIACIESIQCDEHFKVSKDPTVLRKCYNAMAFVYDKANNEAMCQKYCELGLKYSYNTSSIYKIAPIAKKYLFNISEPICNNEVYNNYLSRNGADYWFLTYSHD